MKTTESGPLYQRVKRYISDRIERGELRTGMQIQPETELAHSLGVSRMTVNRALRELTSEGRLSRVRGRGTFVTNRKPSSPLLEIRSVADEIRKRGGMHSTVVHLLQEEKASPRVAAELSIPPYSTVYHSIISHLDNGVVIQLGIRYILPEIAPDFLQQDFTTTTVSEYLLSQAPVSSVEHVVEAVLPERWIRELLQISEAEPCLFLQRKTWVAGREATFSTFYSPGSRYSLAGRFNPPPDSKLDLT